jgi:hypothetical protein
MSTTQAGWYDDGTGTMRWWDGQTWTEAVQPTAPAPQPAESTAIAASSPESSGDPRAYIVRQLELPNSLWGSDSGAIPELENVLNSHAAMGYRLHTISGSNQGRTGFGGGVTLVFEKLD